MIAEIGSNHNQDIELAKELIHLAAESGADAVKFQSLNLEKQYNNFESNSELKALFEKIKLDETWYPILAEEARKANVDFFSAPTYLEAISLLEEVDVPLYKIASPQIRTFPTLIRKVAQLGKPLIISVGYCNYSQIENAINICLEENNDQIVLLHCVSEYPTQFEKVNLRTMDTLSKMFDSLVGLSDHTMGYEIPAAAVALGATVIEKHFTISRSMDGPDHFFALEPKEFKQLVEATKNVYKAMGSSRKVVTSHERKFAEQILVRWIAKNDIEPNDVISDKNIMWLRSTEGISDEHYQLLGNIQATRRITKGSPIKWEDIRISN